MTWRSIETDPPASNKWVLVRGPSNYSGLPFYANALWRWHANQGKAIWYLPSNDRLSEFGWEPDEWMELPQ